MSDNVNVYCRIRPTSTPFNYKLSDNTIKFINKKTKSKFKFDEIFDQKSSQDKVFHTIATPIIKSIAKGYNATILAYGQTGSGKTHTMMGFLSNNKQYGIIPKTFFDIFRIIHNSPNNMEFYLSLSFLQIYNNELFDLLPNNPETNKCQIRDGNADKIFVQNLNEIYITDLKQAFQLIQKGLKNRKKSATYMNKDSSRSHAVLSLTLTQEDRYSGIKTRSKLNLVDLAGSEKIKKSGAKGQQIKEALNINKSLSALGNCIKAILDPKAQHVPFRESALTRLLRDSLGGNCKTSMIINISVRNDNIDETVSSLRFGQRAKQIKTTARINRLQSREQLALQLKQALSKTYKLLSLINDMSIDISNALYNNSLLSIGDSQSYNELYALKKAIKSDKYKDIIDSNKLKNILSLKKSKSVKMKQDKIRQQQQSNNDFNWKKFPKATLLFSDHAPTCGESKWLKSDSSQPSEFASGMSSLGIMPSISPEQEMKDKEFDLEKNFKTFDASILLSGWQTLNKHELDTIAQEHNMNPEVVHYAKHIYEMTQSDYSSDDDNEDITSQVMNDTTIIQYTDPEKVRMMNVMNEKIKMLESELRSNKKTYTSTSQTLAQENEKLKQLILRMRMESTRAPNVPRIKTILKGNKSFVNDIDEKYDANTERLKKVEALLSSKDSQHRSKGLNIMCSALRDMDINVRFNMLQLLKQTIDKHLKVLDDINPECLYYILLNLGYEKSTALAIEILLALYKYNNEMIGQLFDVIKRSEKRLKLSKKHKDKLYKALNILEFEYIYDFDQNGLLHHIINNTNLDIGCYVNITSSELFEDEDSDAAINILGTDPTKYAATVHRPNVYFLIKLMNGIQLKMSKYTIRHPQSLQTDYMINWNLDGSNDGVNWTTLSQHNKNTIPRIEPEKNGKFGCSWDVQSNSFFSQYRLISTGINSSKELSLVVGGIEFYGKAVFEL